LLLGKGDMIGQAKFWDRKRKVQGWVILMFVAMSVNTSLAQVSPGTVSYAYTGSAIPADQPSRISDGGGIKAGPFRIHPFLGMAEIYTDNAFSTKSNRKSDFIHAVSPGLQVELPFSGLHQAVVDYRATQFYSQQFSQNNVLRQDLKGHLLFNFPGGLNIRAQAGYIKGFDFRGSDVDIQALEPTTWNSKSFVGTAEILGSWAGARLRVGVTNWVYENNNQGPTRDRTNRQGDVTLFGTITPKTFLLFNVGVSQEAYDQNIQLDSTSVGVNTGLRWSATGKTTGEIQVGYQIQNFDRAPITQPAGSILSSGGNGSEIVSVSGNLNWAPNSRLNIGVRPFRSIEQSGVFGTSVFTRTGLNLTANYGIGTRTTLNGNFQYSNNAFTNDQGVQTSQNRTDNFLGSGIGLTYRAVKWLGVKASYQYQQRNSTIDTFEFYANTLMVSIQGVF
jgi:polysaccharide biosynthesis protein VpsM